MLKLPSPSVVCAQNSPVILHDRLDAQAVDLDVVEACRGSVSSALGVVVARQLVDELAQVLRGVAEARPGSSGSLPSSSKALAFAEDLVHVVHRSRRASRSVSPGVHFVGTDLSRPLR